MVETVALTILFMSNLFLLPKALSLYLAGTTFPISLEYTMGSNCSQLLWVFYERAAMLFWLVSCFSKGANRWFPRLCSSVQIAQYSKGSG